MPKIKIRYIKTKEGYFIEKKTWFRWKRIGEYITTYGNEILYKSTENKKLFTKNDLLKETFGKDYENNKEFIEIIKYPFFK